MGSSDNETGLADCSVGSIVWVRRRNGSWWPGKIVGPEDLSAVHLLSPRSGTPVKLLGREDASVDWYNLEKSKRVKAFRCGEFDDCIERAESAQGMPPKKREKYARREDAILHALELEKQLVELKHGQSGYPNGKSSNSSDAAKATVAPCNHDDKQIHPKSHLKEPDAFLEGMKTGHHFGTDDDGEGSQLEGNGNNSEVIPRMRDLQDLGIRIPASKHKLSSGVTSNGSSTLLGDENTRPLPSGTLITANIIQTYSKGFLGRKRKSHAVFPDESLVRKRDKRRPLVQVLQSSPELPVQQSSPAGEEQKGILSRAEKRNSICLSGESSKYVDDKPATLNSMASSPSHFEVSNQHPAALNEEHTSGSSESTETDPSETDSLNCDADVDMLEQPDATLKPSSLERSGAQGQHRSTSLKEPEDLAIANDAPPLSPQDLDLAALGMSQWQNKGKRNVRRPGKKSTDVTDRKPSGGSMYGWGNSRFDDPNLSEKNLGDLGGHTNSISNGLDDIVHSSSYLDGALVGGGRHGFSGKMKSVLVDVDLKVQSSHQREHVPMISLRSKFNGKAIVGHPIQIEALENGSSEILLGSYPDTSSVPSMWKTARRTANFRVPRPHPAEDLQSLGQDKKGPFKKLSAAKNSCLPTNKKFSRKPLKKMSLSSGGQKTKTLSSIGVEQKGGNSNYLVNGLLMKGDSGPTAVACIPVKLVFSRMFEVLVGRHQ